MGGVDAVKRLGLDGDKPRSPAKGHENCSMLSTEACFPILPKSIIPAKEDVGNPSRSLSDEQVFSVTEL